MGCALADALEQFVPAVSQWAPSSADTQNRLPNGRFIGSSSGLATGWSIAAGNGNALTHTASKITRTGAAPGEAQQIAFGPSNVGMQQLQRGDVDITGLVSGDTLTAFLQFERSDYMVQAADQQYMQLNLIATGASGEIARAVGMYRISSELYLKNWPTFGTLIAPPLTYGEAWTGVTFQAIFRGIDTGRIRFDAASVMKGY
jgi:hypothetical protein